MARNDREGPRGRFRIRVIFFVLVPVLVLGVSYFLLVEYIAIRSDMLFGSSMLSLRLGGLGLVLLALILAVAAGYLLADRMARPIRLLLHYAESGELPSGPGLFVHHRDWEVFLLYRRIHVLIQQNRSGASALAELESLQSSFDALRTCLSRTGQNGVLAPVGQIEGPCADIAELLETHRARLLDFFRELKARTEEVRSQLDALETARESRMAKARDEASVAQTEVEGNDESAHHENDVPPPSPVSEELRALAVELRRVGTVLALETERLRSDTEDVGRLYREFQRSIGQLEELARRELVEASLLGDGSVGRNGELPSTWAGSRVGDPEAPGAREEIPEAESLDEVWQRLREDLGSLERRLEEVEER